MPRFKDFRPAGVIPATLLALNEDMSIDERQTRRHLRDCALVDGVSAVTVNGHASEVHAAVSLQALSRVCELNNAPEHRLHRYCTRGWR